MFQRNSVVSINGKKKFIYNHYFNTPARSLFPRSMNERTHCNKQEKRNKWKCIEMEINKTTLSVYYTARLFGFAPYSIAIDKQNKLNQIQVKYSRFLSIYSVILLAVLAVLTNFGLYIDAASAFPIRWVSEMKWNEENGGSRNERERDERREQKKKEELIEVKRTERSEWGTEYESNK